VDSFFVISGYLVTGSYLTSKSPSRFAVKRLLRLVPALVIAYPFSLWLGDINGHFVSNPIPYIVNGSLWTLTWEADTIKEEKQPVVGEAKVIVKSLSDLLPSGPA
jgi:hypothetical protein